MCLMGVLVAEWAHIPHCNIQDQFKPLLHVIRGVFGRVSLSDDLKNQPENKWSDGKKGCIVSVSINEGKMVKEII